MKSVEIKQETEFEQLLQESYRQPVLVFKHSPHCSISHFVERSWLRFLEAHDSGFAAYWVDVIHSRGLSRSIADQMMVNHQSPQALYIQDGKCTSHASHGALTVEYFSNLVVNAV